LQRFADNCSNPIGRLFTKLLELHTANLGGLACTPKTMFNSSLQKYSIKFLKYFQTVSPFELRSPKLEVENAFTSTVPTSLSII
jgi:hypothetical protein